MPANGKKGAKALDDRPKKLLRPEDLPQVLRAVSPDTHRGVKLEVEIGCGNGHFMIEYCRLHPLRLFIGVEIKKKRCLKAQAKIDNQNITNARVIYGSAEEALHYLPDGSVDTFHLYYPDPWPKSKHRRRRFLRKENIEMLQRKLTIGGFIFFVTDFFDYYFHTKVLVLLQEELELSSKTPSESVFQSMFARRFLHTGKSVHLLAARKKRRSANDQMPD